MGPQAARPRRKLTEIQGKVMARGSDSGNGRGREIPRGRLWYLMQLDQQGRRITTGAGARLVPSSSSFRKLASLLFLVKGFFLITGLPVSYWSSWAPYLCSLLGSCSFFSDFSLGSANGS